MKYSKSLYIIIFSLTMVLFFTQKTFALNEWDRILDLKGSWKFSIGDDKNWANSNFDDSNWETIHVPAFWEEEGFYGYNGYGWYRKEFVLSNRIEE